MDKNSESYLDNLLMEFSKEPPEEKDERIDNSDFKKTKTDKILDSLEDEFDINEIDEAFLSGHGFEEELFEGHSEENKEENAEEVNIEEPESEEPQPEELPSEELPSEEVESEEFQSEEAQSEEAAFPSEEVIGDLFGESVGSEDLFSEVKEPIQIDDSLIDFDISDLEPPPSYTLDDSKSEVKENKSSDNKEKKKKKKMGSNQKEKKGFLGFFKKLFSNIPLTEEEINAIPTPEEELEQMKEKKEQAKLKKEEKKAKAEENKKLKAKEAKKKAAENKAKKKAKEEAKKEAKKNAELKRLRAEAALPPEGKINKAGAFIVLIFFLLIGAFVIFGAGALSYDLNIAGAKFDFERREYNKAFNKIRGMEIKEKDMEIRNKIQTVMFVNKQLNSYNNFYAMGNLPNALDSLVKGLYRYDKYITYATQIGIQSDLNYIRKQIMTELEETYSMSERDVLVLMGIIDKKEYSENVYKLAAKASKSVEPEEKEEKEFVP